jgi:hypothetical protein
MTEAEANKIIRKWSRKVAAKWEPILTNFKNDIDKSEMSVILESEPKQILISDMSEEERLLHEAIYIVTKGKK